MSLAPRQHQSGLCADTDVSADNRHFWVSADTAASFEDVCSATDLQTNADTVVRYSKKNGIWGPGEGGVYRALYNMELQSSLLHRDVLQSACMIGVHPSG